MRFRSFGSGRESNNSKNGGDSLAEDARVNLVKGRQKGDGPEVGKVTRIPFLEYGDRSRPSPCIRNPYLPYLLVDDFK